MGKAVHERSRSLAYCERSRLLLGGLGFLPVLALSAACGSSSQSVTGPSASQQAAKCAVQAAAEKTTFPAAGGSSTVRVEANRECAWSVRTQATWVTVSAPLEGTGPGTVTFAVAANQEPSSRNGGLTINDREIQLSQEARPCEFQVSSHAETLDAAGGEKTIQLTATSAQCEWNTQTDASWIEVAAGRQGKGNGAVTFRVGPHAGATRAGTLTIAGIQVRIEQHAPGSGPAPAPAPAPGECTVSISPVTFNFGAAGGSGEISVSAPAGCAWPAESLVPWITIASRSATSGPGVVSFRVAATDGPARAGLLRIATSTATVSQAPGCAFNVAPLTHSVPVSGAASAVTVSTADGCAWTASTNTAWINLGERPSGTGSGRLEFSVAPNTGPERSGSLQVAGRTVTVSQPNGCRYDVTPATHDAPPGGGPAMLSIATAPACPWNVTGSLPWITPSATSGVGPAQIQMSIAPNNTPPRSGTLTVAGRTFVVTQASPCAFTLNPDAASFSGTGGPGLVLVFVSGACTWGAASDVNWISVTELSPPTGSGFVNYTVAPNPGAARSGTVVIAGVPHRVTQAAR